MILYTCRHNPNVIFFSKTHSPLCTVILCMIDCKFNSNKFYFAVEKPQYLSFCSMLKDLSFKQEGSGFLSCHGWCDRDLGFRCLIRKTVWFFHLLEQVTNGEGVFSQSRTAGAWRLNWHHFPLHPPPPQGIASPLMI